MYSILMSDFNMGLLNIKNEINNLTEKSLDKELDSIINEYYRHEEKKIEIEKIIHLKCILISGITM